MEKPPSSHLFSKWSPSLSCKPDLLVNPAALQLMTELDAGRPSRCLD